MRIGFRHIAVALIGSLAATAAAAASSAQPENKAAQAGDPAAGRLFAIVYRPGPGWKAGQPMHKQALGEHVKYYAKATDEGRIFAAGGLMAVNGGLAILTMPSLEEAEAFLAADPAIKNGTFTGEVHAWTPRFVSKEPLKP